MCVALRFKFLVKITVTVITTIFFQLNLAYEHCLDPTGLWKLNNNSSFSLKYVSSFFVLILYFNRILKEKLT